MSDCKYCNDKNFNILIESQEIGNLIYFIINKADKVNIKDIEDCMVDKCVVLDIRRDSGYIRLGDPHEMSCIDHSDNFQINFCPMCGCKLNTGT